MIDLISRRMPKETAIALLNNLRAFSEEDDEPAIDMAIEALSELKTGEWVLNPILPDIHRYMCSNCKSHHRKRYNYCPSCGAMMRGEEE